MSHKLLLADDSVTIQRVIELTFADEDVQVVAVGDGKQAIDRLQSDPPDIVLADIGMPERDGYEVASFIRNTPALAHIPVLLLTGAFEPIDEGRAREVGCDGVLVKPFEPQMVISRVKELLSGKRRETPAPPVDPQPVPVVSPAQERADAAPAGTTEGTINPPSADSGASIDDYFDRLDAAFSEGTPVRPPAPEPAPASPEGVEGLRGFEQELAGWDPLDDSPSAGGGVPPASSQAADVTADEWQTLETTMIEGGSPVAPFSWTEPAPEIVRHPAADVPPESGLADSAPAESPKGPTLAEAFAALLAAERGEAVAPPPAPRADISDEMVDRVTTRVAERLGENAVRDLVLQVAERLVREEIERLKGTAR